MRRIFNFTAVVVVVLCVITIGMPCVTIAKTKPVVIRLVIPTPEGEWPQTFRDKEMAKRFNNRSNGEYTIEVHTGMALAKLPEFFDAVRIGVVEMAVSPWGMFGFLDQRFSLLEVPFLFNNNYAVNDACKELLPHFDKVLQEKFNAKGLALWNSGGLGLYSRLPVKTLEDWKGLQIGSLSQGTAAMVQRLGGAPVSLPFTDVYQALQKNILDGAIFGSHGGIVFSFTDICKHFTAFSGTAAFNGYSINKKVWEKMPPHIQKILQEETIKAAEWNSNLVVNQLADMDLEEFKTKGVSVYYLPKLERERWEKEFESLKKEKLSGFGELGMEVKKIADEVNKKHEYSEKGMM